MQPLQNCIGPTIRIGREILCLPYAAFLHNASERKKYSKISGGIFHWLIIVDMRVI